MNGPPAAPAQKWQATQAAPTQQWQAQPPNPQQWAQYQQQGAFRQPNNRRFQQRGRVRGRGNVAGPNTMVQYQPGGYQAGVQSMRYPQQQQQQHGNTQGGYQQQPQGMQYGNQHPLPTNFLYCWSHGYAVSAQHNSMTCMNMKL